MTLRALSRVKLLENVCRYSVASNGQPDGLSILGTYPSQLPVAGMIITRPFLPPIMPLHTLVTEVLLVTFLLAGHNYFAYIRDPSRSRFRTACVIYGLVEGCGCAILGVVCPARLCHPAVLRLMNRWR